MKRASERAEHAERSMLLLEQRLMEKDSFLQEWKRMAAEQKGIESERLQEHIKVSSPSRLPLR